MRIESWKKWVKDNAAIILRIGIVLLFLGLAIWAITLNRYGLVIANHEPWLWLTVALVSVGPELAGIVIGVVTIDYLNERRQDEQFKKHLILQMGSSHNDVTDTAIRALRARGWLYDGSLSGANLSHANLSGADLQRANLSGAILWGADLTGASLSGANLSRANLQHANLSRSDLQGADLGRADLLGADLTDARLVEANLSGASLFEANLNGADLFDANLSETFLSSANLNRASLFKANLSRSGSININLSGASLPFADLSEAFLHDSNLSGANMWYVDLSGANLQNVDLSGAILPCADLSGIRSWTIARLEQAQGLEGATMPDGIQLGLQEGSPFSEPIEGPTFEVWEAQYLAKHGGTVTDIREMPEYDDSAYVDPFATDG